MYEEAIKALQAHSQRLSTQIKTEFSDADYHQACRDECLDRANEYLEQKRQIDSTIEELSRA